MGQFVVFGEERLDHGIWVFSRLSLRGEQAKQRKKIGRTRRVVFTLGPMLWSISNWENIYMAYVIAEPCIGTKDTACVDACPVDCIHPKKDEPNHAEAELLYIDPVECIDCGACVPVCPVSAIFALDDLPEKWSDFTARNAAYYGR
jgi:NAD-dependent dihydropyrimidine dehydrogenase PreA subunit